MDTNVAADIIVPVEEVQDGLSTVDASVVSRAIIVRMEIAVGEVVWIRCN